MLGIVFTTTEEAAPFVRRHTEGRVEALDEDAPIHTDDLLVAVTGPGKIKATLAAERLLHNHDLEALLHTGTCTALSDELSLGTIMGASFVLEGDRVELDAPTYPRMPLECPYDLPSEATLVSQDHRSDDPDEQSYWERIADARDETAYAVAYVAAQHGTPCYVAKAVAAQAGDDSSPSSDDAADTIASFLQTVMDDRAASAA
jgi:nucleoside phosphorylase